MATRGSLRLLGTIITIEFALVFIGQRILIRVLHHPEWGLVWTLLVVGAHFFPMSRFYRPFRWLGAGLCGLAMVTVAGATGADSAWYTIPSFGGAALLWATAVTGLAGVSRPRTT